MPPGHAEKSGSHMAEAWFSLSKYTRVDVAFMCVWGGGVGAGDEIAVGGYMIDVNGTQTGL
jgi:hypothetical protein